MRWRLVQNLGVLIVGGAFAFGIGELLARTVLPPPPPTVVVEARFLYDQPQQQLLALGARLGIPVLDLLPILREHAANDGEPLFYDHCHPTAAGNRVIARAIVDFLGAGPPANVTGVP